MLTHHCPIETKQYKHQQLDMSIYVHHSTNIQDQLLKVQIFLRIIYDNNNNISSIIIINKNLYILK